RPPRPLHSFPPRRPSDLDVAVPWHRRDAPGVLGAEVERERPAPAEPVDAEPVAAGPRLLLGVVGGGRDVAEVLLTRHFAGDGAQDRKSTRLNSSHGSISY